MIHDFVQILEGLSIRRVRFVLLRNIIVFDATRVVTFLDIGDYLVLFVVFDVEAPELLSNLLHLIILGLDPLRSFCLVIYDFFLDLLNPF